MWFPCKCNRSTDEKYITKLITKKHNNMNIKRTIIASVAILASVAMVAPSFAGADTISDLMAQIAALQAQLNSLSTTTTTTSGNVPAACVGVTFSRNLVVGSIGSDVMCMQVLMNAHGYIL